MHNQTKVLIAAFACKPGIGSEPGIGWRTPYTVADPRTKVWVLTAEHNRKDIEAAIETSGEANVTYVFVSPPAFTKLFGYHVEYLGWLFTCYQAAKRLHREVGFDLTHHVSYVRYWTPPLLALLPVPFIWGPVAGREPSPINLRRGWQAQLRGFLRKLAITVGELNPLLTLTARRSSCVLACSTETASRMRSLGARNTAIAVPVPVMGDVLDLAETLEQPRSEPDVLDVISVVARGRLVDWKCFHLAVSGLARAKIDNLRLRIFRSGPELEPLRQLSRELGVSSQVVFEGDVPRAEMLRAMRGSFALIHPSLHDGGASVLLEAMALGVPTISLDMGGPATFIDTETGFAVDPTSQDTVANGIAAALRSLVEDPSLRTRIVEAARQKVNHDLTWERRGELLKSIYDDAARPASVQAPSPTTS